MKGVQYGDDDDEWIRLLSGNLPSHETECLNCSFEDVMHDMPGL